MIRSHQVRSHVARCARLRPYIGNRGHPDEIFEGRHYGTIFGTLALAMIFRDAAGPWLAGALNDWTGSYASAFWIAILFSVVSTAAI
jgi:hypothetical protein